MTIEQGASEADVRMGVSRLPWVLLLLVGGIALLTLPSRSRKVSLGPS